MLGVKEWVIIGLGVVAILFFGRKLILKGYKDVKSLKSDFAKIDKDVEETAIPVK